MNLILNARYVFHSLKGKVTKSASLSPAVGKTGLEDLFSFPLRHVTEGNFPSVSQQEQPVTHYQQKLYPLELGIFDTLETTLVTDTTHQVTLRSSLTGKGIVQDVQKLVKELHKRYGKDDTGYDDFTPKDEASLQEGGYWSGRLWQHTQSEQHVPLNLYADEQGPALTLLVPSSPSKAKQG